MNLAAVEALSEKFGNLDLIFMESGGDNLSATFSPPELADLTIYGSTLPKARRSRVKAVRGSPNPIFWLSIKPIWPLYVGASLEVMERDTPAYARGASMDVQQFKIRRGSGKNYRVSGRERNAAD